MNTQRTKKGGKKRPQVKKPSLHSFALKPDWINSLSSAPQPTPLRGPQFALSRSIMPIPEPQKSFGELLFELGWEVGKHICKQTAPVSYNLNQAMFTLAPSWPPKQRWLLGVGAIGTAMYGFGQVVDRIEDQRNRR